MYIYIFVSPEHSFADYFHYGKGKLGSSIIKYDRLPTWLPKWFRVLLHSNIWAGPCNEVSSADGVQTTFEGVIRDLYVGNMKEHGGQCP